MKILMINVVSGVKSTGRICTDIAKELIARGHEVRIAYGRESAEGDISFQVGNDFDVKMHALKARVFDTCGFESTMVTKKFIQWIDRYQPDIVHLHNLHGYYINIAVLFEYLKQNSIRVIWTLHDCWSFTGHCSYFDFNGCEKWKTECNHCPQLREYPQCLLLDRSEKNYHRKIELYGDMTNLEIVTPSVWLKNMVERSFLGQHHTVSVIPNGIDTTVFSGNVEGAMKKAETDGPKVVLGVAAVWNQRKGLKDILQLAALLDSSYKVVVVGLDDRQIHELPAGVTGIKKTNSVAELADLYRTAYVFVNPTYEDNYPTTNLEAIACGTPVITYDTGGSPESAGQFGIIVKKGDIQGMKDALLQVDRLQYPDNLPYEFSIDYMVEQYIGLYEKNAF